MAATERHLVVARLRDEIRRMERRPARREGVVPCGREEVDTLLPGGGFRRGALTELAGGPASGKTAIALSVLAALAPEALVAWVDGSGELYPPAAAALGVDLARLLVVRPEPEVRPDVRLDARERARGSASWTSSPRSPESARARPARPETSANAARQEPALAVLWTAEALLASGAFAAVAVDALPLRGVRGADAAALRLQAAVEKGGAVGLWLTPERGGLRLPAAARLELSLAHGGVVARRADRGGGGREATDAA